MAGEPWMLSVAMLAVIALLWGGIYVFRRRDRRQGLLMLAAAAVILGNVLIWAWP